VLSKFYLENVLEKNQKRKEEKKEGKPPEKPAEGQLPHFPFPGPLPLPRGPRAHPPSLSFLPLVTGTQRPFG